MTARFIESEEAAAHFKGKSVVIVGSAPSVMDNDPRFIDSHDVVVRVNNYKISKQAGYRCDVFYSFFGMSIRKTVNELKRDGVKLCLCKCPDDKPIQSAWHEQNMMQAGIDFRTLYRRRQQFWFCDTYIPTTMEFLVLFNKLNQHVSTTGFAAIWDILKFSPKSLYLTGFDFFESGLHNVDEKWRPGKPDDPIGHRPDLEMALLGELRKKHPITVDKVLEFLLP